MFFNGYRKDADTTARGVWNFIFAVLGAGVITVVLNSLGAKPRHGELALNIHFTAFNWIGALLLWVICGPVALGFLLVAGRNLPAADYGHHWRTGMFRGHLRGSGRVRRGPDG